VDLASLAYQFGNACDTNPGAEKIVPDLPASCFQQGTVGHSRQTPGAAARSQLPVHVYVRTADGTTRWPG